MHLPLFFSPYLFQITFHFQTAIIDENGDIEKIIDDSKKIGHPMELILGKKFKMPVWEECIKSMRLHEVSEFIVKKDVCSFLFLSFYLFALFF